MDSLIEGILPLWKEKGMTSFDCVFKVRRMLGIKKVGHAGTLDPAVDGVLPIAIGKGTKVLEFLLESDKTYTGEVYLGYATTTEDATGDAIVQEPVSSDITTAQVDAVLEEFEGEIEQTPPMFSAVKVDGKRLYEYAFEGIEVERPSRQVTIYQIKRTSEIHFDSEKKSAQFSFEVTCSKGTYVRTLAVDIGRKLGYPAHMSQLTRSKNGRITKEDTYTLDEVESAINEERIKDILLPIEFGLDIFPKHPISEELWNQVRNGRVFPIDKIPVEQYPVLFTYENRAIAIYDVHPTKEGIIKPTKVFRIE